MEGVAIEDHSPSEMEAHNQAHNLNTESSEKFQKFIYDLFEKNGVLHDLRAYLRGHIVNVLKSAQTGDPPACQKHFTQRLELTHQALNMLIAEYLLRSDLNYTLSVFVSEIPLANMVFDFAKTLMQNGNTGNKELQFKDSDVWSILNYLGVKCDSDHASSIVKMYQSEQRSPLLLCILRCLPLYRRETIYGEHVNGTDSIPSSIKSSDSDDAKCRRQVKCKHYAGCHACQTRYTRLKDRYKRKKKGFVKDVKPTTVTQTNVETLMKNISVMERNLIDEMFHQLKSVYEAEVEMLKQEEGNRVQQSITNHALQLQKRQDEMENAFKSREAELESAVRQKKQFLWGLARALREQHEQMSRAMLAVRRETERLTAKEDSLKTQLTEAEQVLKKRGEDMRQQISNELVILEGHLESMKKERDNIQRERLELQDLKSCDNNSKVHNQNKDMTEDLRSHYDLLKNELGILRKYLETTKMEAKCVIERCTMTELCDVTSKISILLNNEQDGDRNCAREEERCVKMANKVVNDFKKAKNVNFSQANLDEVHRERSQERLSSASSVGEWCHGCERVRPRSACERERDSRSGADGILQLREENERLTDFARQQSQYISELSGHSARLQAELAATRLLASAQPPQAVWWRPRTAPAGMTHAELYNGRSVNVSASANAFGCRQGAGEELSLFSNARPRIVLPGDTLPFIGVMSDRHSDSRRHLINQWRALRRRMSPLSAVTKLRGLSPSASERCRKERPSSAGPSVGVPQTSQIQNDATCSQNPHVNAFQTSPQIPQRSETPVSFTIHKHENREKSPKSVLREAKIKLRNKSGIKEPPLTREKSPNSVLREAKLRLRKLEIEAEAVEKSYLDFRKRQSSLREDKKERHYSGEPVITREGGCLELRRSRSLQKFDETFKVDCTQSQSMGKRDFDKYLREYAPKLDIGQFRNKNTAAVSIKPIPDSYSVISKEIDETKEKLNDDFLETPITEFRKLYQAQTSSRTFRIVDNTQIKKTVIPDNTEIKDSIDNVDNDDQEALKDALIKEENEKAELEILKSNITKLYNLKESPNIDTLEIQSIETSKTNNEDDKNLLTIEIETVTEANNLKITECEQDVLLVVESSVEHREIVESDSEENVPQISTNMTILISPKRSSHVDEVNYDRPKSDKSEGSVSLDAARLTRSDALDAIFHAHTLKEMSSLEKASDQMAKEIEDSISEAEKDVNFDYQDDFSADVDNYNSRSEYENNSPISLPKTSEDENFWDS